MDNELNEHHEREPYYEDEIDLYQLIQVLLKRKKLIVSVFLVAVIVAIAASYIMKPVYRVSAVIGPMEIPGEIYSIDPKDRILTKQNNFVDTPENMVSLIVQNPFHYKILSQLSWNYSNLAYKFDIKATNKDNSKYISINIDSTDPEKAKQYLSALISEIDKYYLPKAKSSMMLLYNERKRILNERHSLTKQIEILKNKLLVLGQQYARLQKELGIYEGGAVRNSLTSIDKLVLTLMLENKDIQRQEFMQEIEALKFKLENLNLHAIDLESKLAVLGVKANPDTQDGQSEDIEVSGIKIIQEPTIDPQRVSPKRTLMVAVAGVLGLFVGIFAAFAVEFWQSHKVSA